MRILKLSEQWRLHEGPLSFSSSDLWRIQNFEDGWHNCSLPCYARMPLIRDGLLKDPVLSDYADEGYWVEKKSWWFERKFSADELDMDAPHIELFIESIDAHGEVFLNGIHIGTHKSAFYPFIRQVKRYIAEGENTLTIRVTTGFESVTDEELAELDYMDRRYSEFDREKRGDTRRSYIRKPQYNVGWDWAPRAVSVGLAGNVELRCLNDAVIRNVRVETVKTSPTAIVNVEAEIELNTFISTADADVCIEIYREGTLCTRAILNDNFLCAGVNFISSELEIKSPQLWWPNGYGDQPLYDVRVAVTCGGGSHAYRPLFTGLRTVELDTSRAADGRYFAFIVNGTRIFCKGANYIPSDLIYMRVTPARHGTLVREAAAAGFNMLRIWGGGIYEREDFYELCDQHGIMLWHDFMLACAVYPDHKDEFVSLMEKEMDYQTKRLNHHPCMVLWCGGNENQWIFKEKPFELDKQYGMMLANSLGRRIVQSNTSIPYWNGSPFGGNDPNDENIGDIHHWHLFMMNPDIERRVEPLLFDGVSPKFVSEYGYIGPTCIETIDEYMDFKPYKSGDMIWLEHTNIYEADTVARGIEKHYGFDPALLTLEQYLLYAGMVQSVMYGYSLDSFRAKPDCAGGLFWMFNDAWGEIGWTVIDYSMRRKISYYGVKRAFAPIKFILRLIDGYVVLTGCNDTPDALELSAEVGVFSLDGMSKDTKNLSFTLPAASRAELARLPLPDFDAARGVFAVLPAAEEVGMEILRLGDTSSLALEAPKMDVSYIRDGKDMLITVTAGVFLHGVHIDLAIKADCNFFDLLPGQTKTIRAYGYDGQPAVSTVYTKKINV